MSPDPHATAGPPATRHDGDRPRYGAAHAALYSTLRFIGRHVDGFWPAIIVFFLLAGAIGIALTALLVAAAGPLEAAPVKHVDESILRWLAARRTPLLDEIMTQVTTLGDGVVLFMLVLIVSVFLWLSRHHWSVYVLLMGVLGGGIVNTVLKSAFGRPRPDVVEWLGSPLTQSFPSGHAMSALIAYGSVAYLIGRLEPTPRLRRATWATALLLIVGIGASRVYLGVHYPTDVVGGFIAGLVWLGFVGASVAAIRFFAPRRPATAREEKGLRQQ
jgi:undecaprenyl-diphosphatase